MPLCSLEISGGVTNVSCVQCLLLMLKQIEQGSVMTKTAAFADGVHSFDHQLFGLTSTGGYMNT